jgi:hypothetical protein
MTDADENPLPAPPPNGAGGLWVLATATQPHGPVVTDDAPVLPQPEQE